MDQAFERTAYLLGAEGVGRLLRARVIVFGLGGVGGSAAEPPRTVDPVDPARLPPGKHTLPGSVSFVPTAAGLALAGRVVCDLAGVRPDAERRA